MLIVPQALAAAGAARRLSGSSFDLGELAERHQRSDTGRLDAGHRAQPRERLFVEAPRRGRVAAGQAGIDVHDDAALEREAGIGDRGLQRRAHEHAGGGERDERQRQLAHDQHVARREARPPAARHFASLILQLRHRIGFRMPPRRAQAEEHRAHEAQADRRAQGLRTSGVVSNCRCTGSRGASDVIRSRVVHHATNVATTPPAMASTTLSARS